MIARAADAAQRALQAGISKQIQRVTLPKDFADDFTDWPGGLKEKYEVAEPLARSLLRKLDAGRGGVVSRITTQPLSPEDYSALILAQAPDKQDDAAVLLFLSQEDLLERPVTAFLKEMGPRLTILLNPSWQSATDFGFFSKRKAEAALAGFVETYSLTSFSCKARTVAIVRAWPGPWQVFLQTSSAPAVAKYAQIAVFERPGKPSYSDCEAAVADYLARQS